MGEACYVGVGAEWVGADEEYATAARAAAGRAEESLWYPGATRRPISRNYGGPLTESRGLVLHVQEGRNSLFGWFSSAKARASSHWWVSAAGEVEQYVPADRVAWTQGAGNRAWHSVETAGYHTEPLTAAQIHALAGLYRWGAHHWDWPLRLAESPEGTGLGWHGMGAPAWGHAVCPGVARRRQRGAVLDLATDTDEEADVAAVRERQAAAVLAALRGQVFDVQPPIRQGNAGQVIGATYNKVGDVQATLGGVVSLLQALARRDLDMLLRAVRDPGELDRVAGLARTLAADIRAEG